MIALTRNPSLHNESPRQKLLERVRHSGKPVVDAPQPLLSFGDHLCPSAPRKAIASRANFKKLFTERSPNVRDS